MLIEGEVADRLDGFDLEFITGLTQQTPPIQCLAVLVDAKGGVWHKSEPVTISITDKGIHVSKLLIEFDRPFSCVSIAMFREDTNAMVFQKLFPYPVEIDPGASMSLFGNERHPR